MSKEMNNCCEEKPKMCKKHKHFGHGGSGDAIYGFGVIGAMFYFLQGAGTLTAIITGIVKAIFWPALVVLKVLQLLAI